MSNHFLSPDGHVTDRQQVSFLNKMTELHKRFKDGTLSPEFTLSGIQNLIEGQYKDETKLGILKLFGTPIEAYDKCTPNGFGPEEFFENNHAEFAVKDEEGKKAELLPLFKFNKGECSDNVILVPYKFIPKDVKISEVLQTVNLHKIYPKITLGHIRNLIVRYTSEMYKNGVLYEGDGGNYFLIRDINGNSWFVWLWLHGDGRWYYQFINTEECLHETLELKCARFWLLSKPQ